MSTSNARSARRWAFRDRSPIASYALRAVRQSRSAHVSPSISCAGAVVLVRAPRAQPPRPVRGRHHRGCADGCSARRIDVFSRRARERMGAAFAALAHRGRPTKSPISVCPAGFSTRSDSSCWFSRPWLPPSLPRMTQGVLVALADAFGFVFVAIALPSLFDTIVKRMIGRARPYVGTHDDPFALYAVHLASRIRQHAVGPRDNRGSGGDCDRRHLAAAARRDVALRADHHADPRRHQRLTTQAM